MAPSFTTRCIRFTGNAILVAVFVFCAVLLAIRFVVFPRIDDYRAPIAEELARQLGQPVAVDAIVAGWDGWNPKLAISGLAIRDRANPAAPPVLLLPKVDLVVAWTSILAMDLRLRELTIERPELAVRRDSAGRLHIAGVEIDPDAKVDDTRFTDWLLRQREINVRDALITWNDELRGAPPLVLEHVMFRVEQSFGRHQFGLVGNPPAELASPLDFRGEITAASSKDWRTAKGRFYVRLDYADVARWREWIPLLRPVESGQGAVRMWFDFADGKATNVVADLELTGVSGRVNKNLPQLELSHLGGRVTWKSEPGRRELVTEGLTFRTQDGQVLLPVVLTVAFTLDENTEGAITGGRVAFDKVDVAPLSALAEHLPLPEQWRRELVTLALRGSVTGGKYAWDGPPDAPTRYSGGGAFSSFAIAASAALPGAAGVSGSFTFDETHGALKLDSRDMRVSLPRVFADTLMFDTASGNVGWSRGNDGLRVDVDNLRFATPHTSGNASGSWRSRQQGPGILDLKAQLARGEAQHLYRYLPLTLDRHVRDWLRLGIKQGVATDVKIALAGDLAEFPFADPRRGQFLVTFHATDVTLDYADGWPELTGIDGDVKFEGTGLSINAKRGRIFGAEAGPVKAEIPHLGVAFPLLSITGEATGASTDFLRFVDQSPVAGWIGNFTDGAQVTGNGKLTLNLQIPLGKGKDVKVAGDYQFIGNQVRVPGVPTLTQVNGHLVFTEQATQSRELSAETFGGATRIAVSSSEGRVRIAANGVANLATLKSELDLPLVHRVSGTAEYQFTALARTEGTSWTLESNLKGANVELPAPVGKTAAESAAIRIERREAPGKSNEDLMTVDYRGEMRVVAHRMLGKNSATVDRALLLLGPAATRGATPDRPGLWVRGQMGDLDLDEWLALYAKEAPKPPASASGAAPGVSGAAATGATSAAAPKAAGALELNGIDLATNRIDIFGRVLHDLKVVATRADSDWRMRFAGREVDGTAVWRGPAAGLPNGRVMARLTRFVPPGPDELHPVRSEIEAGEKAKNTWPELDIAADAFVSRGGHDLGKFELLAQPVGPDWRITKLALVNPAGRIDGNGWWRIGRERQTTEVEIALDTEDAGAFLDRFGYPVAVKNAPTKISGKLAWNGAPNDFDYPTLSGNFTMLTGAGQFTKIDPGMGKLLGVLSLQALPRRMTLDFRDVFSEGFAFDDVGGDFKIQKGLMHTDDLKLEGPAATVTITGDIDLAKETQRLDVRVKPALSSSFSAGAAVLFLANPIVGAAVGAGTLLAQKLFNNPLDQMFSYDYRVTGSWSDPQVERGGRLVSNSITASPDAAPK